MTVKELIEELQKCNPDMPVHIYTFCEDDLGSVCVEEDCVVLSA